MIIIGTTNIDLLSLQAIHGLHVPVQRDRVGETGATGRHPLHPFGCNIPGVAVALLGPELGRFSSLIYRQSFRAGLVTKAFLKFRLSTYPG